MPQFVKNQTIGPYVVAFPIKDSYTAETYRVKDSKGKNYFLKLFTRQDGASLEIEVSHLLDHPGLSRWKDDGRIMLPDGSERPFIVYEFMSGETLAECLKRQQAIRPGLARERFIPVLEGLRFMHQLPGTVLHNEVTAENVFLDQSTGTLQPKLIDFGHVCRLGETSDSIWYPGIDPFSLAPEAYHGVRSVRTDIFAAGAVFFRMLYGMPPYYVSGLQHATLEETESVLKYEWEHPLRINDMEIPVPESLLAVVSKALAVDPEDRFDSVDEFLSALKGECKVAGPRLKKRGGGFDDVAGMKALKAQLQSDVIDMLHSPELAESLGLSIPNGLLFYGPPGCGKTYFAEKFAEELGCGYKYVKCSDVASPYIHGGQEKIAALFEEARKKAPFLLFFDEIDAMMTDRSRHTNVSESGEVNEFLAQLNNCGKDGVIVIGATNKPDQIDEAAMRAGRFEYRYYIPLPDMDTRKELFLIHLKKRSKDDDIDFDRLASLTEGYISADITLVVNQAARSVFQQRRSVIGQADLEDAIRRIRPSLSPESIRKYEDLRDQMNGTGPRRNKIGF